ncbi:MAG: ABC transporter substrate-binding protein, partial [Actinomycetota bacterium]
MAGLLLLSACGAIGLPPGSNSEAPLRIAVRQPQTFDPALARDPAAVLVGRQVFQPLVQFHPKTLALQPGLA